MADERRQIRAVVRALEGVAERVVAKIVLDVTANLIETTPVDTGWARANWVPAIGAAYAADLRGVSPTIGAISGADVLQVAGQTAVATGYRIGQGSVFVSNNVPYITRLNDGSSSQAPAGFVQRAIAKAVTRDIVGLRV
jgi:hypothetical protein